MSEKSLHVAPPGLLLVLSAPSGAGKTTLARKLLSALPDAVVSISYTTRAPRGAERHGVEYFFVDDAVFDEMVEEGAFAEWAEVHGARYGSPKEEIDRRLSDGKVVIFDIDVQGGEQLQAAYPEAATVLIAPPSMSVLEQRLRGRSTDDDLAISRRLAVARDEMVRASNTYGYLVVNDDLDLAFRQIEAVVEAERLRMERLGRGDWSARLRR